MDAACHAMSHRTINRSQESVKVALAILRVNVMMREAIASVELVVLDTSGHRVLDASTVLGTAVLAWRGMRCSCSTRQDSSGNPCSRRIRTALRISKDTIDE